MSKYISVGSAKSRVVHAAPSWQANSCDVEYNGYTHYETNHVTFWALCDMREVDTRGGVRDISGKTPVTCPRCLRMMREKVSV